MDIRKLEEHLNEAVEDYKRKVNDTCDLISDENCKKAVRDLSDDVGHCFADFSTAIISALKQM